MGVYLEIGGTRTFAGAIDWPGWARSGRDEDGALEALLSSGEPYARVLRGTRLGFRAPTDLADLRVVERLEADATARYLVRRVAWHVLDHAWEIEDRT